MNTQQLKNLVVLLVLVYLFSICFKVKRQAFPCQDTSKTPKSVYLVDNTVQNYWYWEYFAQYPCEYMIKLLDQQRASDMRHENGVYAYGGPKFALPPGKEGE